MSKPQIVLVCGAWHAPDIYMTSLTSALSSRGYKIHTRQMPSVGNPTPPTDLTADIAALRTLVSDAISPTGNDVIVICHSWGGIITGSALDGLSKREREASGQKGGVVRAGYMAAFMLPAGGTQKDAPGTNLPAWVSVQPPQTYATSPEMFYNDLPPADQDMWFSKLQSHALGSVSTPPTGESWMVIPSSYLLCELDQAIPEAVQVGMIEGAKGIGADVQVTRIRAGHSPFLSRVEETAEWIRGVAGEVL
jgi:pimeloyl-ACP methyl ester carboxylesterase